MLNRALAIANNDLVYLWWSYSEKIPGCLGFTIHRMVEGKPPRALPGFVGFEPAKKGVKRPRTTTDYWPIQAYQWKDLFVPEETEVRYKIIPVSGIPGKKLEPMTELAVVTEPVVATDKFGKHRVVFNRGIISTQSLARRLPKGPSGGPNPNTLRKYIGEPGNDIRNRLAGEAIEALSSLLGRARSEGGKCFCALYEFTDPELIELMKKNKSRVELVLSNADSSTSSEKIYDGTNAETREELRLALGESLHDRLLAKGNYIGHNKFVVYVNSKGEPQAVLTGSMNWTSTGLCAQSNNIIIVENGNIATQYLDYWNRLVEDDSEQGAEFRTGNAKALPDISLGAGKVRIWFSPNTKQKVKPKDAPTPPDLKEVFDVIGKAQHGVLFLVFNPGRPSIATEIKAVAEQREKAGRPFFVRGAISDSAMAEHFATRVYNDSVLKKPNRLITGVAGVPDQYSYWEKELAQLGHAVIHDKILVIDPFSDNCVVVTGSHNAGYKASYSNDENMCIIRGNREIAEAYTAHVLDVVNHYNWRYKLQQTKKAGEDHLKAYYDLDETDTWQDKYFKGNFLKNRDLFFFPNS